MGINIFNVLYLIIYWLLVKDLVQLKVGAKYH